MTITKKIVHLFNELNDFMKYYCFMYQMMLTPMWKGLETRLREQAEIVRQTLGMVASGMLTIRHAETFALTDVGRAHEFLEAGKAIGKVTLRIGP